MRLLMAGVFADIGAIMQDRFRDLALWTALWVMPLMSAILFAVSIVQIRLDIMGVSWLGNLLALYVPFIASFWLQVPAIRIASEAYHADSCHGVGSFKRADSRERAKLRMLARDLLRTAWVTALGGSILFTGVISGGLLFLIPGVWLFLNYFLFMHAAVIEESTVFESFQKAGDAAKGRLMVLLAILLLTAVGEAAFQAVLELVMQFFVSGESGLLGQTLVHALFLPLQASLLTAFYMRCSKTA